MLRATVFALVAGLSLSACGSSNDDRGPEPPHPCPPAVDAICEDRVATGAIAAAELDTCKADELRGCTTQHYFRSFPTKALPDCRSSGSTKKVNANVATKLFKGGGLWDERVVEQTHGLQRYWSVHELWFHTDSVSTPVHHQHAMVGTRAELEAALRKVGIDPNATYLTPEQEAIANKALGEVMFRPLREMILSSLAPGRVNIFVIPSIASPTLTGSLGVDGEIAGLGVSPTLFARIGESDPPIRLVDADRLARELHSDVVRGQRHRAQAHQPPGQLGCPRGRARSWSRAPKRHGQSDDPGHPDLLPHGRHRPTDRRSVATSLEERRSGLVDFSARAFARAGGPTGGLSHQGATKLPKPKPQQRLVSPNGSCRECRGGQCS